MQNYYIRIYHLQKFKPGVVQVAVWYDNRTENCCKVYYFDIRRIRSSTAFNLSINQCELFQNHSLNRFIWIILTKYQSKLLVINKFNCIFEFILYQEIVKDIQHEVCSQKNSFHNLQVFELKSVIDALFVCCLQRIKLESCIIFIFNLCSSHNIENVDYCLGGYIFEMMFKRTLGSFLLKSLPRASCLRFFTKQKESFSTVDTHWSSKNRQFLNENAIFCHEKKLSIVESF